MWTWPKTMTSKSCACKVSFYPAVICRLTLAWSFYGIFPGYPVNVYHVTLNVSDKARVTKCFFQYPGYQRFFFRVRRTVRSFIGYRPKPRAARSLRGLHRNRKLRKESLWRRGCPRNRVRTFVREKVNV